MFKLVSLEPVFQESHGFPRPRMPTELDLRSACSEGEVFDGHVRRGVNAAVEVAKYDFIEVMPPAIYAPLIAKEQVKDMDELQTIIRKLDRSGRSQRPKPVLATGNVHYLSRKMNLSSYCP